MRGNTMVGPVTLPDPNPEQVGGPGADLNSISTDPSGIDKDQHGHWTVAIAYFDLHEMIIICLNSGLAAGLSELILLSMLS